MIKILFLGFRKSELDKFYKSLSSSDFLLILCENILEVMGHVEKGFYHVVIYQETSEEIGLLEVYNSLESFIQRNKMNLLYLVDRNDTEKIINASEMGISNMIFKPYKFFHIEKKINNLVFKRTFSSLLEKVSFKNFFYNNPIPLILIENSRIYRVNQALLKLIIGNKVQYEEVRIIDFFQFENDPKKYFLFKRLESGIDQYCILKKVQVKGLDRVYFDLFIVRDTTERILIQLNTIESKDYPIGKYNFYRSNLEKGESFSKNYVESGLTKRELEVLKLSAEGLPIKIISQELNISPRTVEKHRANILQKFGAKSIVEVLNKL